MTAEKTPPDELEGSRLRVAERFGTPQPPAVLYGVPRDTVRDTALNLARALDGELGGLVRGDRLLIGLGVAAAVGGSSSVLAEWLAAAAATAGKSAEDCAAMRAVALTCATYNGYYKFRTLVGSSLEKEFDAFQPALRATPFVKSSLSKALVELSCIAVSTYNGCAHCVSGHVQAARAAGATVAAIDEAVRISAVIGALAAWERPGATPTT